VDYYFSPRDNGVRFRPTRNYNFYYKNAKRPFLKSQHPELYFWDIFAYFSGYIRDCPSETTRNWDSATCLCLFPSIFTTRAVKQTQTGGNVNCEFRVTAYLRLCARCGWIKDDAADLNDAVGSGLAEIILWSSTNELGGNFRGWLHKLSATRQLSRPWAWVLEEGSIQWNLWRGFKTNRLCKDALSEFAFHDAIQSEVLQFIPAFILDLSYFVCLLCAVLVNDLVIWWWQARGQHGTDSTTQRRPHPWGLFSSLILHVSSYIFSRFHPTHQQPSSFLVFPTFLFHRSQFRPCASILQRNDTSRDIQVFFQWRQPAPVLCLMSIAVNLSISSMTW
jgi:hypothetical protein